MTLEIYNKKRNFNKTAEPPGKISSTNAKKLYIIQKHAASHLHYDFRLEQNGVLLSWALPKGPCLDPSIKRLAMQTEDHPTSYGSFEGLIPKQEYGGGIVMLWDQGEWISLDDDPIKAYAKGHLRFELKAKKLKGVWSLIKFGKKDDKSWFLIKGKDKYAKSLNDYDITLKKTKSVLTSFSLEQIEKHHLKTSSPQKEKKSSVKKPMVKNLKKSSMPHVIKPQLATLVEEAPIGKKWIHEIKFDGYRILAFIENKKIRLVSRTTKDWTQAFPNVVKALKKLKIVNAILDGEIVLLDENNKSNFQLLQNSLKVAGKHPFIYYAFDILYSEGYSLVDLSLAKRKLHLKRIIEQADNSVIRYSEHIADSGRKVFKNACNLGLEGIISKDSTSPYLQTRTQNWLKVKCIKRQEFIVCGYTDPQKTRRYFGSLFLGYYTKKKQLVFCGNVGTGFTESSLKTTHDLLLKYQTAKNPFATKPPRFKNAHWILPKIICEIEFTEWTLDGHLRHPSFKGLRLDKTPNEVVREKSQNLATNTKTIAITHPEKILYPENKISKGDIASYYESISEWMLPYVVNRPLTLVRCPATYKKCFYQKHIHNAASPDLYTVAIDAKKSAEDYIYIKNKKGLMALIQAGCLELHPWGSTIKHINYPDIITFDLDPAPELAWKKVVAAAFLIKELLEKINLQSFVKTTGGKGLHVVVPIKPEYTWHEIKIFSQTVVEFIVANSPLLYVSQMSKQKRKNKIFIDYLRNQKGATSVCAYSTRARLNAPISTPIAWEELTEKRENTLFTIKNIFERINSLKEDPWKDFFIIKQSLKLKGLKI